MRKAYFAIIFCMVLACSIVAGCAAAGPVTNGQLDGGSTPTTQASQIPDVPTTGVVDVTKPTVPTNAPAVPEDTTYSVTVRTLGGMPMSGIIVEISPGGHGIVGITDGKGRLSFSLPERGDYVVHLSNVPEGYALEGNYSFTDKECRIILTSSLIPGKELSRAKFRLGDVMYDFSVSTPEGKYIQLSDLLAENDLVVLNFWYSNNTWTQVELPLLQEVYAEYGENVEILALNPYPIDTDQHVAFTRDQMGLTFPMAKCEYDGLNPTSFDSFAYPTTVFIDRYGIICMIKEGAMTSQEDLRRLFDHLTADDYQQMLIITENCG